MIHSGNQQQLGMAYERRLAAIPTAAPESRQEVAHA